MDNVSNEGSWELINSDFTWEYEGGSLVKFNGKYLFYCDGVTKTDANGVVTSDKGISVAIAEGLRMGDKWKVPEEVEFVEEKNAKPAKINRKHGTVLCIRDQSQINEILAIYKNKYGTDAKEEPLIVDVKNGWFRSEGYLYNLCNGVARASCEWYDNGNWYWFDEDGTMARNKFVYIPKENKWAYYTHEGKMAKGEMCIGNTHKYWDITPPGEYYWYYFELDTGAEAVSKFVYLPNGDKWVYYGWDGRMVYGEQQIQGNWYYFDENTGKMAKGWVTLPNGKRYHYDEVTGIRIG